MLRFHHEDRLFNVDEGNNSLPAISRSKGKQPIAMFLNGRAAARYRALASIVQGHERFSWN